jgi:hypothetical protein
MHVADDDVDVAVVVDVLERGAAADGGLTEDRTALRADVFEPTVPQISQQQISLVVREFLAKSRRLRLDRSVRREQIEPPVVVEVEPASAETGGSLGEWSEPRRAAPILEQPGSVIDITGCRPRSAAAS